MHRRRSRRPPADTLCILPEISPDRRAIVWVCSRTRSPDGEHLRDRARSGRSWRRKACGPAPSRWYHRCRSLWNSAPPSSSTDTTDRATPHSASSSHPWSCARCRCHGARTSSPADARLMVRPFRHNHLRQQAGSRRALLDRLRRLGGGPHRAVAGVLQTHILNHLHGGGDVFVAFAGLFRNQPQVFAAAGAVLVRLGQVVNDSLPLQMPRQSLAPAPFLTWHLVRFWPRPRISIDVIVVLVGSGFVFRTPCLPGRLEQCQLLFR